MSSTPLVAWSFAFPSGSAMRPSVDDRAVPVAAAGVERRDELPARGLVDVQAAVRVVDVEQAARDDRARAGIAVAARPRGDARRAATTPASRRCRRRSARSCLPLAPHRRRREQIGAGRRRDDLQLMPVVRAACPRSRREREEPDLPVLAALRDQLRGEVDRRGRAEVEVVAVRASPCSSACSCRRASPSADRTSIESPQFVWPSHGAFPVATRSLPLPGTTTAPARPQIAESLCEALRRHEERGAGASRASSRRGAAGRSRAR